MTSSSHLSRRKLRGLLETSGIQTSPLKEYGQSWSLNVDFSSILRGLRRPVRLAFIADTELTLLHEDYRRTELLLESELALSPRSPAIILTQSALENVTHHNGQTPWLWQHYPPFVEALNGRGAGFIRTWLLQRLPISSINPYQAGRPTSGHMFFGRDNEVDTILKTEGSVVVVGPRRVGKTSVAREVTRILGRNPDMRVRVPLANTSGRDRYLSSFAYLDMNTLVRAEDIWEQLLYGMGLEQRDVYGHRRVKFLTRNTTIDSSFQFLLNLLRFKYSNAIFILDEVDLWLEKDRKENWPLFSHIRALVDDHRAATRFVLVGYESLLLASMDLTFPLFGRSSRLHLGGLSKRAVDELVTQPTRELGLKIRDPWLVVESIFTSTGGLPNLVQEICMLMVEKAATTEGRSIDLSLISTILAAHGNELSDNQYNSFKNNSTPLMRLLAFLGVRSGSIHLFDLLRELQLIYRLDLSYQELDQAAAALCVHNVFRPTSPADFEFTNDLLRRRLRDALASIGAEIMLGSLAREVGKSQLLRREEAVVVHDTYNTYNLFGAGPRVTISSVDTSQNSNISFTENFANLRREIEKTIRDTEELRFIEERLNALENAVGTPSFAIEYGKFIAATANRTELLAPFLPALTAALSK